MKRRQEAAEEEERKRVQAEQDARAAAEAQAEAARRSDARDSHDAPGSPHRESGNVHFTISYAYTFRSHFNIIQRNSIILMILCKYYKSPYK